MVVPPSDIRPIIQKMAEYVAKNGEDFEYVVKSKSELILNYIIIYIIFLLQMQRMSVSGYQISSYLLVMKLGMGLHTLTNSFLIFYTLMIISASVPIL